MQAVCPTRARLVMTVYDFERANYQTMPGAYLKAVIANAGEGKRLLRMLRAVVEGGKWQDKRNRTDGKQSVVAENDGPATVGANLAAG